jgi:SSS family transporter
MFARVAIVLFLPSLALNAVTGINIYLCILLMGVVTILYCTMGGIEAVVWGDVIQGFLLVGGAVLSLVWIFKGIDGGMSGFWQTAVQDRKLHLTDFQFDWTRPVFWVAVIGGLSNALPTYTSDQSVVQKYLTVKDTKGTERGLWLNGILSIPITVLFFGIGTALYVFFKQHPGLLNIGMSNTDSIYPHYMMCQLPVGVSGLLIAAVFAAAMSTLASNINSATTVLTEDFYARWKKGAADARKVRFARISGIVVGGLGVVMALALATFDIASLWDQFNFFLGLLTSGLGGLFVMAVFFPRIKGQAALTGFVAGELVVLLMYLFTDVNFFLFGAAGIVVSVITAWLVSHVVSEK